MLKWIDAGSYSNIKEPKLANLYKFIRKYKTQDWVRFYTLEFDNACIDISEDIPFTIIVDFFNHPTIHKLSEFLAQPNSEA